MNKKQIEQEFSRIATILTSQGDVNVLCDLIELDRKKSFIKSWKEG